MKLNALLPLNFACAAVLLVTAFRPMAEPPASQPAPIMVQDTTRGIDTATGFVIADGIDLMRAHCTGCHSSKIITQYRASREVWLDKIRWMQKTQNLWDLGEAEPKILDYLARYYAPTNAYDRRAPLKSVQWYKLDARSPRK